VHLEASVRKRTMDEDFKRAVVRKASVGQSSAGSVARHHDISTASADRWTVEDLPPYMVAMWMCFAASKVLAWAMDAGRFGQPQEETMTYAVTDGFVAGWSLPQVFGAPDSRDPHHLKNKPRA
jgi:hypothetical protein